MYERFTDRARKVMQLANQEAQRFNHEYIGTEHVLLGLADQQEPVTLAADSTMILAQEVRSPFPGTYRILLDLVGDGDAELFASVFAEQFSTHLVYFQFMEKAGPLLEKHYYG